MTEVSALPVLPTGQGASAWAPVEVSDVAYRLSFGTGLAVTSGVLSVSYSYTLPTASTTVLGGVKVDGSTVTISSGVISAPYTYTLPTASTSVLGGVKVDGSTVTINGTGVISASASYSLPTASTTVLGGVKIDGTTITISGGVISAVGGGGGGSGSVGAGTTNQLGYYAANGTTVSGLTLSTSFSITTGTISPVFGTTSGTFAQGNDGRISGAEQASNKGQASGYAPLDGSSFVPLANFPIVSVAKGGTGTTTPGIVAGTNIAVTGTWPNQTVATTGLGTAAVKAASGSGGTVASVTGSFVVGHLATFSDTSGTIQDGGAVPSGGGSSNLSISNTYTAPGAIAITDAYAIVNTSSPVALTLADGTVDGHPLTINNYGTGNATVTIAHFQGAASQQITLLPKQIANLVWFTSLSSYTLAS